MELSWLSLIALLVVIVLSCTNRVHPGTLAIALAWAIAVYAAPYYGVDISYKDVLAGFPVDLFLILTGVSLLFSQAYLNGTLDRLAKVSVSLCRGNVAMIPWMFFLLAALFATVGAGNIASAALIAPTAMRLAEKAKIPAVLMTIMLAHGSLAGALSPIAPTGLIAKAQMEKIGLGDHGMLIFWHNFAANVAAGLLAFVMFGGFKLLGRVFVEEDDEASRIRFEPRHYFTIFVIASLMVAVIQFKVHVGMGALVGSVLLALIGAGDDTDAMRKMPWSVIIMVCGVNVLTALLEKTGGIDRFADLIVSISTPFTVAAVIGTVGAVVSVYSSTSGVVMPAFLPMVAKVTPHFPSVDPMTMVLSVIVAGHLVDSSPLSTIGALCIAGAGPNEDRQALFNRVLFWGLGMAVFGGVWCLLLFGVMW